MSPIAQIPNPPRRALGRMRRAFKELHYSWPWAVIGVVGGVIIGLLSRLPLLPPPNAFTQQFWTTFVGAVGGAAVTVIGTLHFARVSRRKETLDAARALASLITPTVRIAQGIVTEMLPFPTNEEGEFVRVHREMRSPADWKRYWVGAETLARTLDQAQADVQLYKPSCIGIDLEGRRALVDIERSLGLLRDLTVEMVTGANDRRQREEDTELGGNSIEAYRLFSQKLLEASKRLRTANVM